MKPFIDDIKKTPEDMEMKYPFLYCDISQKSLNAYNKYKVNIRKIQKQIRDIEGEYLTLG